MPRTPLYEILAASGARMSEYRGAETASAFGDVAPEFEALRGGCAIYDLGWRTKLIAAGPDRVRWMNGMVTNNVKDLPVSRGAYNFLLNAQGRIQGDMYIYNRGEYLLIDTDASQRDRIKALFEKYIIMDDVEISGARELTTIGLSGPQAAGVLNSSGISTADLQELEVRDLSWNQFGISIVRRPAQEVESYELWLAPQNAASAWEQLIKAGATPVGTEALEMFRIARGIPRYGQDIRERDLPQETAQTRALDFHKGCYVGQEIVERIHSRGNVHRSFTGFRFAGEAPAPETKVLAAGKEVGEITSVAALPSSNEKPRLVGLGYLRREAAASDIELRAGEARVSPSPLPFKDL